MMINYLLLNKMKTIIPLIGFILMGITLEVFWTSILNHLKERKKNKVKLIGVTYLWMFPIYAIVPIFYLLTLNLPPHISIFIRGLIYFCLFYILEFTSGWIIKKSVGESPWDYSNKKIKLFGKEFKSNFKGLICLQYAPIWYIYGILGELYYLFLINI